MKSLLKQGATISQKSHLPILIATLFSIVAIIGGFSDIAYVPLSYDRTIDITIVAVMFASMIGGYSVGIPLAVVWSAVTHYNLGAEFYTWSFWSVLCVRIIFVFSITWFYAKFKEVYKYSPWNVYRAVFASILLKNLVSIPFDMAYSTAELILQAQQMVIEMAICCVFMSLLIKHLRQIHILNGVKKKQKGEKKHGH